MNKKDLTLNDLQWLICHKTKPRGNHPVCIETKFRGFMDSEVLLYFMLCLSFVYSNGPSFHRVCHFFRLVYAMILLTFLKPVHQH